MIHAADAQSFYSIPYILAGIRIISPYDVQRRQRCNYLLHLITVATTQQFLLQTPYMTADNINIGIGAILETFEMMSVRPFQFSSTY